MQFKETRVSVKKDFKYGEDERQKFDVYLPPARSIRRGKTDDYDDDDEYEEGEEEAENVRVPMAVFVHGGVFRLYNPIDGTAQRSFIGGLSSPARPDLI